MICPLCSVLCALCSVLCALCSVLCALCSVLCALCSVLFALCSALCAGCALCSVLWVCALCSVVCGLVSVLHILCLLSFLTFAQAISCGDPACTAPGAPSVLVDFTNLPAPLSVGDSLVSVQLSDGNAGLAYYSRTKQAGGAFFYTLEWAHCAVRSFAQHRTRGGERGGRERREGERGREQRLR